MPKAHRGRPPTFRPEPETAIPGQTQDEEAGEVGSLDSAGSDTPPPLAKPKAKAPKAEWVAYAESIGVDSSGSKAQIRKRVG